MKEKKKESEEASISTGEPTHSPLSKLAPFLIIKHSHNFQSVEPDGELHGMSPHIILSAAEIEQ